MTRPAAALAADRHAREQVAETPAPRPAAAAACPACGSGALSVVHEIRSVPANSCILFDSETEAKSCPTGNIRLEHCPECGFIHNSAFDQKKTEYSGRYEETQGFSGTFSRFHRNLAERLIARHDLHGKRILEIGCGKGEFLMLLSELGGNYGLGIDPGVKPDRLTGPGRERLKFIADFYSEDYAHEDVDFVVCKMTLEHIADVEAFVTTLRRGLGHRTGTTVFFQIPEALRILRECAFEDIYHEHCSYFTPGSLGRLFRRAGFDVLAIDVEYGAQYLTIEARPRARGARPLPPLPIEDDRAEMASLVATFAARNAAKVAAWRFVLDEAHRSGRKVALWGSGSKAVAFLSAVDPERRVGYVTDINPYRHNHFMPRSGQRILPPAELAAVRADLVIAMNGIYEAEIRNDLLAMGLAPELRSL